MALGVAAGRLHSVDGVGDVGRLVVAAIDRAEGDLAEYAAPSSIDEVLDRRAGREREGTELPRERDLVDAPALAQELVDAREDAAVAAALRDDRLGDEPDDAPEIVTRRPEPKPAAGGGPGRPAYVARMLEAMVAAGGDFTAAAEALQIKRSSLVGSMSVLRARTDLTEAEAAAIARTRVRKA
jgi:hypothetical protein